jgi:hypothetical protein
MFSPTLYDRLARGWHEAGHAVAALRLGIPLISTKLIDGYGSEGGFTEIATTANIPPLDDALFTAAGGTRSGVSPELD